MPEMAFLMDFPGGMREFRRMSLGNKNRRLFIAALLASVIFVCGMAFFSYLAWSELFDAFSWVSHTREVEQQIEQLLSHVDDVETGQRGYLLAQRDNYLDPYNTARPAIMVDLDNLRRLTADNHTQQVHLDDLSPMIAERLRIIEETISLQKAGRHDEALALVNTDNGKHVMDRIRKIIGAMTQEEERLLRIRETTLTRRAFTNKAITLTIIGLYLTLNGVIAFLLWRLSRMKTLLTVCAWSRNVHHEGKWITFEDYLKARFGINTTHGLSPEEAEKFLADLDGEEEVRK